MSVPTTITEALAYINQAKARGHRVLCGKCRQPATLAIACDTGQFQGVACKSCWQAHTDMIAMAGIFQASGLTDTAFCSRCGVDDPAPNHIVTQEV